MSILLPHISRIILSGSVGLIWGIACISFFSVSVDVILFLIIICVIGSFAIFYRSEKVWIVIVNILLFGVGAFVMDNVLVNIAKKDENSGIILKGEAIVREDVLQKGWKSEVVLQYKDIVHNEYHLLNTEEHTITVIIKDEKYTHIQRDDIVLLQCTSALPQNYKDFDYQKYLAMNGIDYVCEDFSYEIIGHEPTVLGRLSQMRMYMENIVNTTIPAPQSALANGLLFGGNDRLSDEMQDKFAVTGMTHIVAVSGYNVSVIAVVIMGIIIFIGVKRQYAVGFAMLGILFFIALIGFPSSGVRAAVMGTLILIAASYGRVAHAYGAIFFTGAVMLSFNPLLLRYDVGFQLSFLATLGIVTVYPILEKYFSARKTSFGIVEILLLTISAQIFVLPIIAYHFHTLSVVSLPANLLILPIIPITMLFVFLLIVVHFIFYPVSIFFGWMAHFLLSYEIGVINIFSQVSWGSVQIETVHVLWFILYYIMLIGVVYIISKRKKDE